MTELEGEFVFKFCKLNSLVYIVQCLMKLLLVIKTVQNLIRARTPEVLN